MRNRKLLALVLCLLMCMAAVAAHGDEPSDVAPVAANSGATAQAEKEPAATSTPAPVTKEESSPDKKQETDESKTDQGATTTTEPVESTPSANAEPALDKQDEVVSNTPSGEQEDEKQTEVVNETSEQPSGDETGDLVVDNPETDEDVEATEGEPESDEQALELTEEEKEPTEGEMEPGEQELEQNEEELEPATGEAEVIEDAAEINPVIVLRGSINGDVLTEGTLVTIRAEISGIPADVAYGMQWQNNRNGEFQDVPGATGAQVTFEANEENVKWEWRLELTLPEAVEAE